VIARYGGEEFCIVVPQISHNSAAVLAERVREKTQSNPCVCENLRAAFRASFGISHRSQYTPLDELIRIADQFLYATKRGGRNRVSYQTDTLA
jgi:diguanylate cyclase (GGDEF)-like protein